MYDLQELYQEVVMDHNRRPRNYHKLEDANRSAEGFNPLCGDQLTVYLEMADEKIKDIGFQAMGCAISKASFAIDNNTSCEVVNELSHFKSSMMSCAKLSCSFFIQYTRAFINT